MHVKMLEECGTCARGADDAVVNVGAAVDGDLQTVVGVMVLC